MRTPPTEERFWPNVEKGVGDGCWLWVGSKLPKGYGMLAKTYAHRFSYEIHTGTIPAGLLVCHSCDNPSCVRPDHLFLGTYKENTQDMIRKGRTNGPKGTRAARAKLTELQVLEIRAATDGPSAIAKRFNLNESTVCKIRLRKRWAHILDNNVQQMETA